MSAPLYTLASVNGEGQSGVIGTQTIDPGSTDVVSSCIFQIANLVNSFSCIPRVTVIGAVVTPTGASGKLVTGQNVQYINFLTGAVQAAGTALAANGIYGVYCPGCQVELITSAGSADCWAIHLPGRCF